MNRPLYYIVAAVATLAAGVALPAQTGTPASTSDQEVIMNPFEVSTQGDRGYATANTVGATMVNTPILDTSLSIVAFNQQFMSDVMADDPIQAAQWASGVTPASNGSGIGQISLRGQVFTLSIRDGILDPVNVGGASFWDAALAERVEVIKGPVGTLYGDYSGAGGLLNFVTKAPEPTNFGSYSFQVGADEEGGTIYRGVADVNAVNANDTLEFRTVVVGQQGHSVSGFQDSTAVISPMLAYNFGGGGRLMVRYTYQNPTRAINTGDWTYDANDDISYFIDPKGSDVDSNNLTHFQLHTVDVEFTQPFKTGFIDWTGRAYFRYNHVNQLRIRYVLPSTGDWFLNAAGQRIGYSSTLNFSDPSIATIETGPRSLITNTAYEQAANENVDFAGNFDVGPAKNTLLVYGAYLREELNQLDLNGAYADYPGGVVVWSDVGVPLFNHLNPPPGPTNQVASVNTETVTALASAGIQDNVSLFDDKVNLAVGFRQDHQNQTTVNYLAPSSSSYGDIRDGTSRKYGIVVGPFWDLRFFYNYSTTFTPNGFATNVSGVLYKLPNLVPETNEAGVKTSFFDQRLVLTGSWFYTTIGNETVQEIEFNSSGFPIGVQVPAGQAVIKGWESDGTWAVTDNIDLLFGFGSLQSLTQTHLVTVGVPTGLNYRALGKYTFRNGPIKGLFAGVGVIHNGPAAVTATNTANIPSYTIGDAFLGYDFLRHWRAQVNVDNITNVRYVALAIQTTDATAGNPRDASFELTYRY